MNALLEVSLDVRPTAQAIIASVLAGDAPSAVETMNMISNDELYAVTLLLASSVDTNAPLMPVPWAKVSHAAIEKFAWIVRETSRELDVNEADIYSRSNLRRHAGARQVACHVAMSMGLKVMQISRILSRDHSTVLHAVSRVADSKSMTDASHAVMLRIAGSQEHR